MSTMNRPAEKINDDLNAVGQDFKRGVAAVKEDLVILKDDAKSAASHAARQAAEVGKEALTKVKSQADDLHTKTVELVRANPMAAIFISMGIGAILSRLISRD